MAFAFERGERSPPRSLTPDQLVGRGVGLGKVIRGFAAGDLDVDESVATRLC